MKPKTALGRRLMELREQAIESGMQLLTLDEIQQEVARRRVGPAPDIEAEVENLIRIKRKAQSVLEAIWAHGPVGREKRCVRELVAALNGEELPPDPDA